MISLLPRSRFLATRCPMFRNQAPLTRTIFTATFVGPIYFKVFLNVTRVFPHPLLASPREFYQLAMVLLSVPRVMWKAGHANVERCSRFSVDPLATSWELGTGRSGQFNALTTTTSTCTGTYPNSHCELCPLYVDLCSSEKVDCFPEKTRIYSRLPTNCSKNDKTTRCALSPYTMTRWSLTLSRQSRGVERVSRTLLSQYTANLAISPNVMPTYLN